jgi:hypothetical protein
MRERKRKVNITLYNDVDPKRALVMILKAGDTGVTTFVDGGYVYVREQTNKGSKSVSYIVGKDAIRQ